MSVETKSKSNSPATSRTSLISSSVGVELGISHYVDGLAELEGDTEALGDTDALGDGDALADRDGDGDGLRLTDADGDELGDGEADGLADWLTVVIVGDCQRPSASTIPILPFVFRTIEPLP